MPAGRWPDKREQAFFALKTLRCERVAFFDATWLRRPCLDRFAVFAKASRTSFISKQKVRVI